MLLAFVSFGLVSLLLSFSDISDVSKPVGSSRTSSESSRLSSQTYKKLAHDALTVSQWPDSHFADKMLKRDERTGKFLVPSFPLEEAPLAVVALLDRNEVSRRILNGCDLMFTQFISEMREVVSIEDEELDVWIVPDGTHHITVTVFQEHPILLVDEAQRQKWRPVEESVAELIYQRVSQNDNSIGRPALKLDSLLLTGDGVMIAGFLDTTPNSAFQLIRDYNAEIGEKVIGTITSRPKTLIHVTVGRVLALPSGLDPVQREAVNSLVRIYNTDYLPASVAALHKSMPPRGAIFELTELTMIRDIVWTLRRIKEYGTWRIV